MTARRLPSEIDRHCNCSAPSEGCHGNRFCFELKPATIMENSQSYFCSFSSFKRSVDAEPTFLLSDVG